MLHSKNKKGIMSDPKSDNSEEHKKAAAINYQPEFTVERGLYFRGLYELIDYAEKRDSKWDPQASKDLCAKFGPFSTIRLLLKEDVQFKAIVDAGLKGPLANTSLKLDNRGKELALMFTSNVLFDEFGSRTTVPIGFKGWHFLAPLLNCPYKILQESSTILGVSFLSFRSDFSFLF